MKIKHILYLTVSSVTMFSCAPSPGSGMGQSAPGQTVPAPELKQYRKIPMGHRDPQGRANMVVSPYRPYNIIDVTGYHSGNIVGDPSTARINPATGRYDPKTCKCFRIP